MQQVWWDVLDYSILNSQFMLTNYVNIEIYIKVYFVSYKRIKFVIVTYRRWYIPNFYVVILMFPTGQ